jgi:uncharacterized membrane protein YkoI
MHHTRTSVAFFVALALSTLTACKSHTEHVRVEPEAAVTQQPATSLASAIAIAQKSESGARFFAGEVESEGGKVICSIVLVKRDGVREIHIDGASGAILKTETEKINLKTQALFAELELDPGAAPVTVAQAIEAAQKQMPDRWVSSAHFGRVTGALVYMVELAESHSDHEPILALVSAVDGRVQVVKEMDEEADEKGEADEKQGEKKGKP